MNNKIKLIIDYNPIGDYEGTEFYFYTWSELFRFITMASETPGHSYLIEDFANLKTGEIDA